ncbi:MAG TPA: membrane receptor RagA [Microscillaceae bacterium]|nr:membrane receptor RagA [Microscillaceae bacterium]
MRKYIVLGIFFFSCLALCQPHIAQAQGATQTILLSGVILDANSNAPVPGVHLYIPGAGRGTSSGYDGYFTLPAFSGDSIVISAIGYQKQYYIMPRREPGVFSVVIELKEDQIMLPIVEVFPYPTEEIFKEAFLALKLEDEEQLENIKKNLNQTLMMRASANVRYDGAMNSRYYLDQQAQAIGNENMLPTIQLLNPFAWARFIKSVKQGDLRRGKWRDRN